MTHRPTWAELAAYFDRSGNLSIRHRNGEGWRYRLRIAGYDRKQLDSFRALLGSGSISKEKKPNGLNYYRLELDSLTGVLRSLRQMLPHLVRKRELAEEWFQNYSPS